MLIRSLSFIGKHVLIKDNLIPLSLSSNKNKMSTLENVIDGLNHIKCRIKVAVQKRDQVYIIFEHIQHTQMCFIFHDYIYINFNIPFLGSFRTKTRRC